MGLPPIGQLLEENLYYDFNSSKAAVRMIKIGLGLVLALGLGFGLVLKVGLVSGL